MRRMYQLKDMPESGRVVGGSAEALADVRVRVDFEALARVLGPKAMKARSFRVELYDGAVTVEAFNIRKVSGGAS